MTLIITDKDLPGSFGGLRELEREPPVRWLIPNWLAARELSCIYGQGGTFKSYIALAWTLQLALRGVPTLYIAAEGTSGLRSRVDAWRSTRTKGEDIPDWHYYNANVHLDKKVDAGLWKHALLDYNTNVDLIVVDTLARNFTGDENSAKEVGEFIEGIEHLRRDLECAILVIHHMGVTTGRERGTAALRNATFAMFQTSRPQYNNVGGGSVELACDRMKDAPIPDEVRCYFDTVALDVASHGEVMQQSQAMRLFPPKRGRQKPAKKVIDPDNLEGAA